MAERDLCRILSHLIRHSGTAWNLPSFHALIGVHILVDPSFRWSMTDPVSVCSVDAKWLSEIFTRLWAFGMDFGPAHPPPLPILGPAMSPIDGQWFPLSNPFTKSVLQLVWLTSPWKSKPLTSRFWVYNKLSVGLIGSSPLSSCGLCVGINA